MHLLTKRYVDLAQTTEKISNLPVLFDAWADNPLEIVSQPKTYRIDELIKETGQKYFQTLTSAAPDIPFHPTYSLGEIKPSFLRLHTNNSWDTIKTSLTMSREWDKQKDKGQCRINIEKACSNDPLHDGAARYAQVYLSLVITTNKGTLIAQSSRQKYQLPGYQFPLYGLHNFQGGVSNMINNNILLCLKKYLIFNHSNHQLASALNTHTVLGITYDLITLAPHITVKIDLPHNTQFIGNPAYINNLQTIQQDEMEDFVNDNKLKIHPVSAGALELYNYQQNITLSKR